MRGLRCYISADLCTMRNEDKSESGVAVETLASLNKQLSIATESFK